MTSRPLTQRISIAQPAARFENEMNGMYFPRALSRPPQGRGRDYRGDVCITPPARSQARTQNRIVPPPEPEEVAPEMPKTGLIGRIVSFLRAGAVTPKKLRLAETVALGEKRFVAIIHAEGQRYLVGGGTSGVALLTRLDGSSTTIDSLSPNLLEAIR